MNTINNLGDAKDFLTAPQTMDQTGIGVPLHPLPTPYTHLIPLPTPSIIETRIGEAPGYGGRASFTRTSTTLLMRLTQH